MTEDEKRLDQLFAQARQGRPELPDALAVRILTDAEEVRLGQTKPEGKPSRALWARIVDGVGGWQGMGGLVDLWTHRRAPSRHGADLGPDDGALREQEASK